MVVVLRIDHGISQLAAHPDEPRHRGREPGKVLPPLRRRSVPGIRVWENKLNRKLVDSRLSFPGMEVPLRLMRNELEIFREANLPLSAEESGLVAKHGRIE